MHFLCLLSLCEPSVTGKKGEKNKTLMHKKLIVETQTLGILQHHQFQQLTLSKLQTQCYQKFHWCY